MCEAELIMNSLPKNSWICSSAPPTSSCAKFSEPCFSTWTQRFWVHMEHPKKGTQEKAREKLEKIENKIWRKNNHIKTSRNVLRLYRWWLIYPFRNCCLSPLWFVGQIPPPSYLCPSPFLVGKIPIWNKRGPRYTYFLVNDSRVFVTSTILLAWLWNPNFRLEKRIVDEFLHFCSWKYAVFKKNTHLFFQTTDNFRRITSQKNKPILPIYTWVDKNFYQTP